MKKIFTFAIAASAVLSAGAVQPQARALGLMTKAPFGHNEVVAPFAGTDSRADENDLSGTYLNAAYEVLQNPSTGEVEGEFIERMADIEIVADPEVTNGYIIKNLFSDHFVTETVTAVNDIKAVFNTFTNMLMIEPGQLLCTVTENGRRYRQELYTVDASNNISDTEPIMLSRVYGQLILQTPVMIGEWTSSGGEEGIMTSGISEKEFIAYIPDGEMTYFDVNANEQKSCRINGLNYDGRNLIYNFADIDPFASAPFFRRGTRVMCDGAYYTAHRLYDGPSLNPAWNINEYLYLAQLDENGNPTGTGEGDTEADQFYIRGTIVVDEPTECVIELPDCGLFTKDDQVYNTYKNVVITYDPSMPVAIPTIEATDNANAPVVYYNLQGVRVENPENGIFIRQQGNKSTKVLVK